MPQGKFRVTDQSYDEVSNVDVPANQYGLIVLAKRHQEDTVPDEEIYFDADGRQGSLEDFEVGTVVTDGNGGLFEVTDEAEDAAEREDERELATVGKSAFLDSRPVAPRGSSDVSKSIVENLAQTLSKAISDEDQRAVIAKAVQDLAVENERLSKRVSESERIAKAEQDLRLEREYIAKAADYNVPVAPEDLGPVLKRMAENMTYEDCAVIDKALTTSGLLFEELGIGGEADDADPFMEIEALANGELEKNAEGMEREQQIVKFLDQHPDAYRAHRAEQRSR